MAKETNCLNANLPVYKWMLMGCYNTCREKAHQMSLRSRSTHLLRKYVIKDTTRAALFSSRLLFCLQFRITQKMTKYTTHSLYAKITFMFTPHQVGVVLCWDECVCLSANTSRQN